MKKFILCTYVLITCLVVFQGCKKDSLGDASPINNVLPPYVQFTSKAAQTVTQGTAVTLGFTLRTGLQQVVTVTYSVSGAFTLTQTATIAANSLTGSTSINVPANVTGAATVTLVKATKADGTALTIGQDNVPANQKVVLNITTADE
jgi:hypothetical protein